MCVGVYVCGCVPLILSVVVYLCAVVSQAIHIYSICVRICPCKW